LSENRAPRLLASAEDGGAVGGVVTPEPWIAFSAWFIPAGLSLASEVGGVAFLAGAVNRGTVRCILAVKPRVAFIALLVSAGLALLSEVRWKGAERSRIVLLLRLAKHGLAAVANRVRESLPGEVRVLRDQPWLAFLAVLIALFIDAATLVVVRSLACSKHRRAVRRVVAVKSAVTWFVAVVSIATGAAFTAHVRGNDAKCRLVRLSRFKVLVVRSIVRIVRSAKRLAKAVMVLAAANGYRKCLAIEVLVSDHGLEIPAVALVTVTIAFLVEPSSVAGGRPFASPEGRRSTCVVFALKSVVPRKSLQMHT